MSRNHTGYPFHTRKNGTELIPADKRKRVIKVEDRGGRRRRAGGLKIAGYVLFVLPILLVISAAAAFILFQTRLSKIQSMADNAIPELRQNEDGIYELSWLGLKDADADFYYVDVGTHALFSENGKKPSIADILTVFPAICRSCRRTKVWSWRWNLSKNTPCWEKSTH